MPPTAPRAAAALERLGFPEVLRFAEELADSPWLGLALHSGVPAEDRGLFWAVLPGDALIWPVRFFIATYLDERHAVMFTYERGPKGELAGFMVQTLPDDHVNAALEGETGRTRLLSRQDESDSLSPASGVSSSPAS